MAVRFSDKGCNFRALKSAGSNPKDLSGIPDPIVQLIFLKSKKYSL